MTETTQRVTVRLLGDQSITGVTSSWSARSLHLIGYLVTRAGTHVSRQHLAGVLWPDSSDAQALTNLRRELHTVRRVFSAEPSFLASGRDLQWVDVDTIAVDVLTFAHERAAATAARATGDIASALLHGQAALAAYGGDLLPGSYDDWVLAARSEMHHDCVDMCRFVAELHALRGDHDDAIVAARRRVRMEPLEEQGYRALMRLQAESGDRAGAISTYHRCAAVIERELGVAPDAATQQVFQALLRSRAGSDETASDRDGVVLTVPVAPRIVGRDAELGVLREEWHRALHGAARLVVVHGGAGVGKSAVVGEAAAIASRDGAAVASSRCFGAGRLALAPVSDWLRQIDVGTPRVSLDEWWRKEVDRLAASGGERHEPGGEVPALVEGWHRQRFFEGLARALLAPNRPLALVLDDVQWCDAETLAFVSFLFALAPRAPTMVMLTVRTDAAASSPDDALAAWLLQARAAGVLTEVTLRPLASHDTARLAEQLAGRALTEEDRATLHAATGGYPLHVVETMRAVAGDAPGSFRPADLAGVLERRLAQLSPVAREVAGLAAAIGREFTLHLLAEASDLHTEGLVRAIDELWRLGVVRDRSAPQGGGYDFTHELLRDAAYRAVSPARRWLLHRRIAQSLELLHAGRVDTVSALLAEQYSRGGRPDRAIYYYRRAAAVASGVFAHAEAVRLHSEALALVRAQPPSREADREELVLLRAITSPLNAQHGYASNDVQAVLERSVELAERLGRTDELVSELVALNTSAFVQGRINQAHDIACRALDLAVAAPARTGLVHFALGGTVLSLGRPREALEHFDIARRQPHEDFLSVGPRPDVHGAAWSAHAYWLVGDGTTARDRADDAIARGRELNHPYSLTVALAYGALTAQLLGNAAVVAERAGELAELCRRHDFAYYREWALVLGGWAAGGDDGLTSAREGIAHLRFAGSLTRMPYWLSLAAELLAEQHRPADARAVLEQAATTAAANADVWWLPEVRRRLAHLAGERATVTARLDDAARLAATHGSLALERRCREDLERMTTSAVDAPQTAT